MPVTIIVGGQFGSEGKGKVAFEIAQSTNANAVVRIGGPNSGHTVVTKDEKYILRCLPTPSLLDNIFCILGAGSYINPEILLKEIEITKINPERLLIDPQCMVVSLCDIEEEKNKKMNNTIGSTESGTGASLIRRISRTNPVCLAKDHKDLKPYIRPTIPFMRRVLREGKRIIIEGTQGYGLSLLHSKFYPYTTSRDTSAAGFLSETGLSPLDVDDIILVIRSYPIRVAGNSGYLANEITWKNIHPEIEEFTSVTKRLRRVGLFESTIVVEAIRCNNPTKIVLNHLDYIKNKNDFINRIEKDIDKRIDYIGLDDKTIILKEKWLEGKK